MRPGLLTMAIAVTALGGCSAWKPRPRVRSDAELRREGEWTAQDARARRWLDREGLSPDAFPARRMERVQVWVEVGPEDDPILLPSPLRAAESLFGCEQINRYRYLPDVGGYVLLHPDRPPTILAADPDRPMPANPPSRPEDDLPGRAFRDLEARIERDLSGVPPVGVED